jgi:hypothetical protein
MINYGLLQQASEYYENLGYKRIEAPWLVTEAISNITKPIGVSNYYITKEYRGDYKKVFVASGEQSFLYLINKGFLPKSGKFQTITPCMRNDSFSEIHTKYFMKLELIRYTTQPETDLLYPADVHAMMHDAKKFFELNIRDKDKLKVEKPEFTIDECQIDILYEREDADDVELGSYGLRKCSFVKWVYGTGLAEPRFSRTVKR